MKISPFAFACWFISLTSIWAADTPDQIGQPFHWKDRTLNILQQVPGTTSVGGDYDGQPDKLSINRSPDLFLHEALSPGIYTLRILGSELVSHLTSKHYAVVGHLTYQNVSPGSFLELENWFGPEQPGSLEQFYFTRTLAEAGPLAKIEGSDADREFALPFDASAAKTPLLRLVLKLHLTGAGYLEFTNVRLVQYPDAAATPPTEATNVSSSIVINLTGGKDGPTLFSMHGAEYPSSDALKTAIQRELQVNPNVAFVLRGVETVPYASVKQVLDTLHEAGAKNVFFATSPTTVRGESAAASPSIWAPLEGRSFLLGIGATCLGLLGTGALFLLARRFNHLRHARELRRIASLDG